MKKVIYLLFYCSHAILEFSTRYNVCSKQCDLILYNEVKCTEVTCKGCDHGVRHGFKIGGGVQSVKIIKNLFKFKKIIDFL